MDEQTVMNHMKKETQHHYQYFKASGNDSA